MLLLIASGSKYGISDTCAQQIYALISKFAGSRFSKTSGLQALDIDLYVDICHYFDDTTLSVIRWWSTYHQVCAIYAQQYHYYRMPVSDEVIYKSAMDYMISDAPFVSGFTFHTTEYTLTKDISDELYRKSEKLYGYSDLYLGFQTRNQKTFINQYVR